ncbi:MAG: hypothetical protein R3A44_44590 [Caldilineaceae bacterium]
MAKSSDFQKQLKYALKWFHDPARLGQDRRWRRPIFSAALRRI